MDVYKVQPPDLLSLRSTKPKPNRSLPIHHVDLFLITWLFLIELGEIMQRDDDDTTKGRVAVFLQHK